MEPKKEFVEAEIEIVDFTVGNDVIATSGDDEGNLDAWLEN